MGTLGISIAMSIGRCTSCSREKHGRTTTSGPSGTTAREGCQCRPEALSGAAHAVSEPAVPHSDDYEMPREIGSRDRCEDEPPCLACRRGTRTDRPAATQTAENAGRKRPEFSGRLLDHWDYLNKADLDLSRPRKACGQSPHRGVDSRLRHESLNS
jgi:hypothetical protein